MAWRVAESLLTLRRQIDAIAPARSKSSDGTIGDASHQLRKSDHNPNDDGVVTAMDVTHDPAHGIDAPAFGEMLRLSEDPRIKYVISNARIFSSKVSPWKWRPYNGANAHTQHIHISVIDQKSKYDDKSPWQIDNIAIIAERPSVQRCTDIVATMFGGESDPNRSAYDNHIITDDEFGVALPGRITGIRPKVRVINSGSGKSVLCNIVDVGPWNTNDPYWEKNSRPQAESGFDLTGRKTNLAGLDLTPAVARALGINGKGKVDWEFVSTTPEGPPAVEIPTETTPRGEAPVDLIQALRDRIRFIEGIILGKQTGDPEIPSPGFDALKMQALGDRIQLLEKLIFPRQAGDAKIATQDSGAPTMPASSDDILSLVRQLPDLLQKLHVQDKTLTGQAIPSGDQLRQLADLLTKILPATKPILGQVNGALGQTIGNLLNGKKTAIGVIGALATSLLSAVPSSSGLGQILAMITPAAGLSPFAMPIFLATTAWGVLGKFEKWAQGTAPLPFTSK